MKFLALGQAGRTRVPERYRCRWSARPFTVDSVSRLCISKPQTPSAWGRPSRSRQAGRWARVPHRRPHFRTLEAGALGEGLHLPRGTRVIWAPTHVLGSQCRSQHLRAHTHSGLRRVGERLRATVAVLEVCRASGCWHPSLGAALLSPETSVSPGARAHPRGLLGTPPLSPGPPS